MPIYEYQCSECAHVFEEWVNVRDASAEAPCPHCGQPSVHIISNTAFVLKGGGWYVTEYGSRKHGSDSTDSSTAAPEPSASTSAASDSTAASGTSAAPATPTAPAPATPPAETPKAATSAAQS